MASAASSISSRSFAQAPAIAGPIVLLGRVLFALIFLLSGPNHFTSQTIAYATSREDAARVDSRSTIGNPDAAGRTVNCDWLSGPRGSVADRAISGCRHAVDAQVFGRISDPMMHLMQFVMFMKNLSMLGAALLISQLGAGPWSLDARRK